MKTVNGMHADGRGSEESFGDSLEDPLVRDGYTAPSRDRNTKLNSRFIMLAAAVAILYILIFVVFGLVSTIDPTKKVSGQKYDISPQSHR